MFRCMFVHVHIYNYTMAQGHQGGYSWYFDVLSSFGASINIHKHFF